MKTAQISDVLTPIRRIVLIARDVDRQHDGRFTCQADRKEAVKCACARLHVPYDSGQIDAALDRLNQEFRRRQGQVSCQAHAELLPSPAPDVDHDEACQLLMKIRQRTGTSPTMKQMPTSKPITRRTADRLKAL